MNINSEKKPVTKELAENKGFNKRVTLLYGKSTFIQKANIGIMNKIPLLRKNTQNKPHQSSDKAEIVPYFDSPNIYGKPSNTGGLPIISGKKCLVINTLVKQDKTFWIRPATLDEEMLKRVGSRRSNPTTFRYAFPGLSITPSGGGVSIVYYGTTPKEQPYSINEEYFPSKTFYKNNGQAVEMRKWQSYVDFTLRPGYDLWVTFVINPELRIVGENPCIAVYFQEGKVTANGAVILGKYLNEPVMFYADPYSCELWTEFPLRAGSGDVESSSVFDQSIGEDPFVCYPIAHNSNDGIMTVDSFYYEPKQVFLDFNGIVLLQQYAEILPINIKRETRALPCMSDIVRPPSIDNLFNGFHLLGVIFGFTKSYCDLWLRGNWNIHKVTSIPVVATSIGKSTKPKPIITLNLEKPTLANLLASQTIECEIHRRRETFISIRQTKGLNGWDTVTVVDSDSMITNHNQDDNPDVNEGICAGLSAELAVNFVRGTYNRNNIGEDEVNQAFLRAIATQRDINAAVTQSNNVHQTQENIEEALWRIYLGIEINGFTWEHQNGNLEALIPRIAALERGQAIYAQFTHIHEGREAGHVLMFFRQAIGFNDRLLFMDVNGGVYEYPTDGVSIENQARHMLRSGSTYFTHYAVPIRPIKAVGFVFRQIPDSDEE